MFQNACYLVSNVGTLDIMLDITLLCLILNKKQGEVHLESRSMEALYITGTFKDKRSPDIQTSYMGVSTVSSTPFQGEANEGHDRNDYPTS